MLLPPSIVEDSSVPAPADMGDSGVAIGSGGEANTAAAAAAARHSSVGTHTDLGRPATSRVWHTTTNMETQTRSDDLFG